MIKKALFAHQMKAQMVAESLNAQLNRKNGKAKKLIIPKQEKGRWRLVLN